MRLHVLNRINNCKVLYVDDNSALLAQGFRLVEIKNSGELDYIARLPSSFAKGLTSLLRPLRQGMRLEVKSAFKLSNSTIIYANSDAIYRWSSGENNSVIQGFRNGYHTPNRGFAADSDGCIYYVEYALNNKRTKSMGIYRSDDGGRSFKLIYEKQAGKIRHFHSIQFDEYEKCLWSCTGDLDSECGLYRSEDKGQTWELVGGGSQLWRSIGLIFTPDYLYWGTDAGSDAGNTKNYIVRLSRKDHKIQLVHELQGPCHGSASLSDGTLIVSTGVEGGQNEKDRKAHIWASRDGYEWRELFSRKKDLWPFRVQYGVIHFPYGLENSNLLHFTTLGLSGCGESYFTARIENN